MFKNIRERTALRLVNTEPFRSGVVVLDYQPRE
jgi:hypothetical protein